jgi:hypothetical protein
MKRTRSNNLKSSLQRVLEKYPESRSVKNRYKLMRIVLTDYYPIITGSVSKDTLELFLREVVFLDRQVRYATEGKEVLEKKILAQQFVVDEIM